MENSTLTDPLPAGAKDGQFIATSRGNAWTDLAAAKLDLTQNVFGITLYNEPASALAASLDSLLAAIRFFDAQRYIQGKSLSSNTVVVIADGHDRLHGSTRALLSTLGLDLENPSRGEVSAVVQRISVARLREVLRASEAEDESGDWGRIHRESQMGRTEIKFPREDEIFIQLAIVAKVLNAGKLDSHWWLYKPFCETINPQLVYQMDTGSCIRQDALLVIFSEFESNPLTAAVAPRVLPPEPAGTLNVLEEWQFGSLAAGAFVDWPLEVASGYLSVIPGQFSAMRWKAIKPMRDGNVQPLDVYFEGLGDLTAFEAMLYLAEDRVLCTEIVARDHHDWQLQYCSDAVVVTDYCQSWGELFRQRRRWCCGYIACRVNYLKNLGRIYNKRIGGKPVESAALKSLAATSFHSLKLLLDFVFPALVLLLFLDLGTTAINALPENSTGRMALGLLGAVTLASFASQLLLLFKSRFGGWVEVIIKTGVAAQAVFLLAALAIVALHGHAHLLGMVLICFAAYAFLALRFGRAHIAAVMKNVFWYSLVNFGMSIAIWIYTIANAHDTSWGTKGLDTAKKTRDSANFKRWLVLTWVTANTATFLGIHHLTQVQGISFAGVYFAIGSVLAAGAVIHGSRIPADMKRIRYAHD